IAQADAEIRLAKRPNGGSQVIIMLAISDWPKLVDDCSLSLLWGHHAVTGRSRGLSVSVAAGPASRGMDAGRGIAGAALSGSGSVARVDAAASSGPQPGRCRTRLAAGASGTGPTRLRFH